MTMLIKIQYSVMGELFEELIGNLYLEKRANLELMV
jgi:hypothetical protein